MNHHRLARSIPTLLLLLASCSSGPSSQNTCDAQVCTGIGGGAGTGAGGAATGGSAGTGGGGGSSGGASGSGGGASGSSGGASGSGGGASGSGGGAGSGGSGGSGPSCPTGRTLCGTDCVDTTSNPLHCGGCGRPCGANQVCSGSACQTPPDCRSVACVGLSYCDLATGLCNPGCALDTQCGANETCDITTHACVCKTGYHQCSGVCLSNTSVASCGPSCSPCATDPNGVTSCSGTACGLTCNAGYKMCGGVCALCPTANVSASACSGTQCVATTCATGFHLCAGQCSANTSVMSCGTSCTPCPTPANGTATCSGTACGITCNTNYRLCNGACAACPTANVTATTCSGASCVALTCTSGGTYHICSGTCVSNTSPLSCGGTSCTACPTIANGMATCNGATCGRLCNSGYALCGNLDVCALCPTPAATTACSGTTCVATSCDSTRHVCGGMCVLKSAVDTCGTSCTPCPAPPANAVASCNGTTCGFKCNTGFAACGSACCTDCRSMSGACTGSDWCSDVSGVCAPVEKLQPNSSSLASLQLFGAHVSISGSLAVVGAPDDENNVSQVPLGAVYVFERQSSGTWLMQGSKMLPSPVTQANYGSAVSLSGQRLLVGASRENGQTGAAYIYDRVAGVWTQQAKWLGELSRDMFGVAGLLDGDRAIVGASRNPGVTPTKLGAAYIYERGTDGTWPAAGIKLGASDGFLNDQFGIAVSLSGDPRWSAAPPGGGRTCSRANRTAAGRRSRS